MESKTNRDAYNRELVSLIKSGVNPEDAKKIADSHIGNYDKVVEKVNEERKACKAKRKEEKEEYEKATRLSARIKAGDNPESAYQDMYGKEM